MWSDVIQKLHSKFRILHFSLWKKSMQFVQMTFFATCKPNFNINFKNLTVDDFSTVKKKFSPIIQQEFLYIIYLFLRSEKLCWRLKQRPKETL